MAAQPAVTAARRGHRGRLVEKSGRIGGRLIPGSVPKIKFDVDNYRRYLENQIRSVFGLEGTPIIMTVRQKGEEDS